MPAPGSARRCCSIAIRCRRAAAPTARARAAPRSCSATGTARTISADLLDAALAAARGARLPRRCNAPYAGGYIVARHGRPDDGVHALQIEIDRSAYLDADLRTPGPGFEGACRLIAAVVQALEAAAARPDRDRRRMRLRTRQVT